MTRMKLWAGLGLLALMPADADAANPIPRPAVEAAAVPAQLFGNQPYGGERGERGEGDDDDDDDD